MKRRSFLMFIVCALSAVIMAFSLIGCAVEPRSAADVIPESIGKPEGLWLYRGNVRMRTDGSQAENILSDIQINDVSYSKDDYSVCKSAYLAEEHVVFYIVELSDNARHIVRYDYKNKTTSHVYDISDIAEDDLCIQYSDEYYYVSDSQNERGLLFSSTGELLCDSIYGVLNGDLLHDGINNGLAHYTFTWYKNGKVHSVESKVAGVAFSCRDMVYYNDYCYFLDARLPRVVDAVGGKLSDLNIKADDKSAAVFVEDYYEYGGHLYLLTLHYEDDLHIYRLFDVYGSEARLVYNFGNGSHGGAKMKVNGSMMYFSLPYDGRHVKYFSYNAATDKIKRVFSKDYTKGSSTQSASRTDIKKRVGEYTFYVDSIGYDDQPNMMGTSYTKTCYYLMREHKGKSEIMQYSLNGNGGKFFDDICNF